MRICIVVLLMGAMVSACASPCGAGVWKNLWDAIAKATDDYANDIVTTGNNINQKLKEHKWSEAFDAYANDTNATGQHALQNSKAIFKALMDIANWVPNQIKKLWEKFVAGLENARKQLEALHHHGGGGDQAPKAAISSVNGDLSSRFMSKFSPVLPRKKEKEENDGVIEESLSRDLGDGFLRRFASCNSPEAKCNVFSEYMAKIRRMERWLDEEVDEQYKPAFEEKMEFIENDAGGLRDIFVEQVCDSGLHGGELFDEYLKRLKDDEILASTLKDVKRRLSMKASEGDEEARNALGRIKALEEE